MRMTVELAVGEMAMAIGEMAMAVGEEDFGFDHDHVHTSRTWSW